MQRVILHCDANSFFASVEERKNPELKKVPMAVAGDEKNRHGIILAKNLLAKEKGVQTPEPIWQAKRKCPNLVLVPPHHADYIAFSHALNKIYGEYTDKVEKFGIDESWLDVTSSIKLFGSGEKIANEIRQRVKNELGITVSVGVSFNKIFAKIGSDYKKPDATTVISYDNFKDIVWKMPANSLMYVGKSVEKTLEKMRIFTIGDIAASNQAILKKALGKTGEMLWEYANGRDLSPVIPQDMQPQRKSLGKGITFSKDIRSNEDIKKAVIVLSDEVATRLRRCKMKCRGVQITLKDPSLKSFTRQKCLMRPTFLESDIEKAALEIINSAHKSSQPLRMITITGINLVSEDEEFFQASIFDEGVDKSNEKREILEKTIDKIREKYGGAIIEKAAVMSEDIGLFNYLEKND